MDVICVWCGVFECEMLCARASIQSIIACVFYTSAVYGMPNERVL